MQNGKKNRITKCMNPRVGVVLLGLSLFSVALSHSAPALPMLSLALASRQFSLPFAGQPSVNTWLLGQLYGNTTGAYRRRNSDYRSGQGIHFGMDFSAKCGTPVLAIGDGVVSEIDGSHGSAPHNLVLEHAGNLSSLYGHLLRRSTLRIGQRVSRGQQIGLSGDSQLTCYSAPHLHLEIRDRSHQRFLNPVGYINADWNTLALLGSFGRGYQRDLNNPRQWQTLEDQPSARRGGALLNNYALPFPVAANDRSLSYPSRIYRSSSSNPDDTTNPIGVPRAISSAGCCVAPFWNKDSSRVLFIDKPNASPAAIYSLDAGGLSAAKIEFSSVVRLSSSEKFAILNGSNTILERLSTGERISIPANSVTFSPTEQQIAWSVSNESRRFDTIQTTVFVASIITSPRLQITNTRAVAVLYGGGLSGWLNEQELLLNGKRQGDTRDRELIRLDLRTKNQKVLSSALNFRGISLAPNGKTILYYVAFDSQAKNGLFALNPVSGIAKRLPWFGSYRWRDANRLVFIPIQPAKTHLLLEWDVRNQTQRILTDLKTKVAVDDWQIAPNGSSIVFVNAATRGLNVVDLPK
jgi:murein DD-endopeptidase MepM/ murein hydrolase activator NlpD